MNFPVWSNPRTEYAFVAHHPDQAFDVVAREFQDHPDLHCVCHLPNATPCKVIPMDIHNEFGMILNSRATHQKLDPDDERPKRIQSGIRPNRKFITWKRDKEKQDEPVTRLVIL